MKTITLSLLALVLTSGCATAYQPESYSGGYSDSPLGNDMVEVSFSGNGFTSGSTVKQYFMRRCAEVTLENGFDFFAMVNQTADVSNQTLNTQTNGTIQRNYYGGYDYSANTQSHNVQKHSREGVIKMFKEGQQPQMAFDARTVWRNTGGGRSPAGD